MFPEGKKKDEMTRFAAAQAPGYSCRGGDLVPKMCPPVYRSGGWNATVGTDIAHFSPGCARERFQPHSADRALVSVSSRDWQK